VNSAPIVWQTNGFAVRLLNHERIAQDPDAIRRYEVVGQNAVQKFYTTPPPEYICRALEPEYILPDGPEVTKEEMQTLAAARDAFLQEVRW